MTLDDTTGTTDHPCAFKEEDLTTTPQGRRDDGSGQEDTVGAQGMASCYQTTDFFGVQVGIQDQAHPL